MLVCEPKFHSWGRCTMALTNMHSDLRFNPSSGLCINLVIYIISYYHYITFITLHYITLHNILHYNILHYVDPLFRILGQVYIKSILILASFHRLHDTTSIYLYLDFRATVSQMQLVPHVRSSVWYKLELYLLATMPQLNLCIQWLIQTGG